MLQCNYIKVAQFPEGVGILRATKLHCFQRILMTGDGTSSVGRIRHWLSCLLCLVMGILFDSSWMLHHDRSARAIKDTVLLPLTYPACNIDPLSGSKVDPSTKHPFCLKSLGNHHYPNCPLAVALLTSINTRSSTSLSGAPAAVCTSK